MLAVSHREARAQARAVIADALLGHLSIEDFHPRWQLEPGDPLIEAIFDETEDTIEHTPGSLVRRDSGDQRFRRSIPYKILVVDGQLLLDDFADVPSQLLLEIRTRLLKQVDLGQDDEPLMEAAREFVAREVSGLSA
jgi:hypothetical protein